jgi:excinuclease ABC subunit A
MTTKQDNISIRNAHEHNLKNIDVDIAHGSFTVVTGVSGSGKSSLVFDTLFAEGRRRYVESLSSYARQFMGRMKKPAVDKIDGLCPAVAIEQKVNTKNSRSTVATSTEIYDYLKLLFSRVGRTFSPISGQEVKSHSVADVINYGVGLPNDTDIYVLAPILGKIVMDDLQVLLQKGFTRIWSNGQIFKIEDLKKTDIPKKDVYLMIDRIIRDETDEDQVNRFAESADLAFWEGQGECAVFAQDNLKVFNNKFELDGITFEQPTKDFLTFNNPYGACKTCDGFGTVLGLDEDLIIPDKTLSVYAGAVAAWNGEMMSQWKKDFVLNAKDFPIHKAYDDLSKKDKELLWNGGGNAAGIFDFFKFVEENSYKIQYRVMAARYRGKTKCGDCLGTRLRKDAGYVKLVSENKDQERLTNLQEILLKSVDDAENYFKHVILEKTAQEIAKRTLQEIQQRLLFLKNVGLGYLALNRLSSSLSGGESQRINLATSLGSSLTGSLYVLDEPSIGLHSRDTEKLIEVLKELQSEENTVLVVEHDEDVMRAADDLIDIGMHAGVLGGNLIFQGKFADITKAEGSLTAAYLNNEMRIEVPTTRRKWKHFIEIKNAIAHNLKSISVKFPLDAFTAISGVSGSGKTTLVKNILYPAMAKHTGVYVSTKTLPYKMLSGDLHLVKSVEMVDQNPIGKSSRSNPVTYIKAYDDIRDLYSKQPESTINGFKPSHFSFNVEGGRCENCQGEGETVIEMQFMADIKFPCEVCNGQRFKKEVLEVRYNGLNISEILNLTVDEALVHFADEKNLIAKLSPLHEVGLGYISLGQSSNTLSGGEAQRVKLAFFLSKASPHKNGQTLFIFDEPTTGLHFHDIQKLLKSFQALIDKGNTIICIEHNLDVIKCADWVIDMGPEAGQKGGYVVFEGTPEELAKSDKGYTAAYLAQKL